MIFRTEIPILPFPKKINFNSEILSLGSCFSVNMAQKLAYYQFKTLCNPLGILFHPLAIEKIICQAVDNQQVTAENFIKNNDFFYSFDVHSSVKATSAENMQVLVNQSLTKLNTFLKKADFLFITFGTAWVYEHISHGIVANCHKIPQQQFTKRLLTMQEIQESIDKISEKISQINEKITIVYSVSPVRHLKDGFVENQVSKSLIISALHHSKVHYFPAYEIMMDELRDYRFYAEDMLHPSALAIDYIWERFVATFIDASALPEMAEIAQIQRDLAHKIFNKESEQSRKFLENLHIKIQKIREKLGNHLFADFSVND